MADDWAKLLAYLDTGDRQKLQTGDISYTARGDWGPLPPFCDDRVARTCRLADRLQACELPQIATCLG